MFRQFLIVQWIVNVEWRYLHLKAFRLEILGLFLQFPEESFLSK